MGSTSATYGSSSLSASSSYSSLSVSSTVGSGNQESLNPDLTHRSVRRRPRISDLQRHQSAPEFTHKQSSPPARRSAKKRLMGRRSVSATPTTGPRIRFASPDRYAASRSYLQKSLSPLHTSHHPSLLESRERLERCRDNNVNVFRSANESRLGQAITRPAPDRLRSFQPPHYTPSFVHARQREEAQVSVQPDVEFARRASIGSVWRLGDLTSRPSQLHAVDLGNGALSASQSNALMVDSKFFTVDITDNHIKRHERRLALALEIDIARRILPVNEPDIRIADVKNFKNTPYKWRNAGWAQEYPDAVGPNSKAPILRPAKAVPTIAFRVLDAPRLKDDFYCSVLAYCCNFRTLAVALNHRVYLWTERYGVRYPPLAPVSQTNYVTSLAFSSEEGNKAILAISRHSGHVTVWSLLEQKARFDIPHPSTACSVAFRPTTTKRVSNSNGYTTDCEDLLVGDDSGRIYYYSIEWPDRALGSITLLAKVEAHSQNVCGLAWAPHGRSFVSGGNDNCALLFHISDVLQSQQVTESTADLAANLPLIEANTGAMNPSSLAETQASDYLLRTTRSRPDEQRDGTMPHVRFTDPSTLYSTPNIWAVRGRSAARNQLLPSGAPPTPPRSPAARSLSNRNNLADPSVVGTTNVHRHTFYHSAAVKAIAFASWQPSLLATSGGSNDRQIHFHHTETGTTLAVITVFAQVTSLSWSLTRREIVATLGYAQPEHEIRIAVFAWPSCECVVSIPWERKPNGEISRALWAIPYPGGPNDAAPERLQDAGEAHIQRGAWHMRSAQTRAARPELLRREMPLTPETSPERQTGSSDSARVRHFTRGEGETWASRTEEEGSLIIACCDQTVKFFEVWAGKSKGKSCGLGSKAGVLGGSKVLEGWCEGVAIEEIGTGEDVIR